ncbi:VOC family protein [Lentzea flaviverrucosa]|uniref:Catechol 2,3-dioxygenase n=1 Tax=Lentzea flaviverrucosa TaxID=200379 RepID=A0A1H9AWR1_9PSEU|nr:VOC family protein [Lentzea flaviverrucosa]RDI31944.1 catechol 2,3-dioxygenase-like lactoylglutathione lyase family enzyme [Lentzea flaviverrucosa]SEP81200.1 Catechol 2,3-dioxygenase [Lentzea flaviverrucosa]
MHHVGMTVTDLAAAVAFFEALGMELEGKAHMEGEFVDGVVGLDGSRSDIAMMKTPDDRYRIEFSQFQTPRSIDGGSRAPINALGLRHVAFVVDDLDDTLARLEPHGAELVRNVETYEDMLRTCYVRGPEGVLVELCQYFS